MTIPTPFVVAEHLQMSFKANGRSIEVLRDFNLAVDDRQFLAILGPSGCGKTTLLRLLGALLKPTGGNLSVGGLSPDEALSKHFFSFVFQNPVLLPWHDVRQNVRLAGEVLRSPETCARVDGMIRRVGLAGFETSYPDQLSGGMKSRVAIARALTFRPRVLLMDEPFGALDDMTRTRLNAELGEVLHTSGAVCFFVTHSIEEAIFLADRVLVLSQRPSCVLADIPVDKPRPRHPDFLEESEAVALKKRIRQLLSQNEQDNPGTPKRQT